jgi:hypothetical protein
MKHSLSIVLAASVLLGLAFARVSNPQDPVERLSKVEKELAALKEQVAEQGKAAPQGDDAALRAQVAKLKETLDKVLVWGHSQAEAAARLQTALVDAEAKGFIAGINPDSRTVLLDGFHSLADSLKAELPAPASLESPAAAPAATPPPAPAPAPAPAPQPQPKPKKDV